jgi:hypothetical protein
MSYLLVDNFFAILLFSTSLCHFIGGCSNNPFEQSFKSGEELGTSPTTSASIFIEALITVHISIFFRALINHLFYFLRTPSYIYLLFLLHLLSLITLRRYLKSGTRFRCLLLFPAHYFKFKRLKLSEHELQVLATAAIMRSSILRKEVVSVLDYIMESFMG